MNALSPIGAVTVRAADLADAREAARIDAFVAAHPEAEFFHRPQWSLAVEQGCRQRAHYLVAESPSGSLVGCLPLSEIRSPLFGNALVSVGFGTGGGPLGEDRGAAARLVEEGWALARRLGCRTMELRGGAVPEGWSAQEGVYAGFAKPLPQGDEAILKAIKRRHRAIRRAQAFDLEIRCGRGEYDRAALYRVYSESVRNLGSPVYPRALFSAMLDRFGDQADILTVLKDGEPAASVLNFYFRGTVCAYWGGGTRSARDCFANEVMYYEVMRHASRRGCTRFDFGRSKVGTGPYAFKMNWGFDPEPLVYSVRTADGAPPRSINPLNPRYRLQVAAWQKLPLWLANRLGPVIARGLG
ncbi:MAG TPA: FemAB family XrtA/PEP-CTERM system-associated protein [Allosphingosinicella sp.]|nr:FemAB family XrtA/PEP-CTERM system-associated protein [Allosphingosinicella sp.]